MDVKLDGKVLIVTGSTQGLGKSIAILAAQSAVDAIIITGRNAQKGKAVVDELSTLGTKAIFVQADLADAMAPTQIAKAAIENFGRIDLLVNSAGLTSRSTLLGATVEDWNTLFAINARAAFFLMQAVVKDMLKRKKAGSIVNILSMNAHCGVPELAIYSGTKGALSTLTKNAANAHLRDNIRVNGINMGWAATDGENTMQAETLGNGPSWEDEIASRLPLGRMLKTQEVAQLALYMLSDMSGLMTGTLLDLEQSVVGASSQWE